VKTRKTNFNAKYRNQEETIVSVERAFAAVENLSEQPDGLSLSDVARHLCVNRAIASKLLGTLTRLGYVWRNEITQTFHLTYRISNISLRQLQNSRILDQCGAAVRALAEEAGELVRLAVVERDDRLTWVISAAGRRRTLQIDPNYGFEISLHTHATGKAWLSTLPPEHALSLLQRGSLKAFTSYSKIDASDIMAELAQARQHGFAISYEEHELGVGTVAAPIMVDVRGAAAKCVGAISLAAPTSRKTRDNLVADARLVRQVAARLANMWPLEQWSQPIYHRIVAT
jgi:IclR family acetate operon transcriptional repressor